jgi:hypothetical protein
MSLPVEKLTEAALALPSDARALLADRLAESLDPLNDEDVRQAWATEALQRLEELRSGAAEAISSEAAMQQVRDSLLR